jgi:hypothetical protein
MHSTARCSIFPQAKITLAVTEGLAVQIKLTLAFTGILIVGLSVRASAQEQVIVTQPGAIPKGFKTYSLFLICNPKWLDPENNADLVQLYDQFKGFGDAIGKDNAAVWFRKLGSANSSLHLAQSIDVDRSVHFCQAWKLKPSEGPHIVILSTFPNEANLSSGLPAEHAVYKLGGMISKDVSKLLSNLTDQLVLNGKVDSSTNSPSAADTPAVTPPPTLWVRLLSATQQSINNFGCAWSFKISAGPVSADLKSCNHNT